MENKKIDIELNDLIVKVSNKIALWYNLDNLSQQERQAALKDLSVDITTLVLEDLFVQMGAKTETKTIQNESIDKDLKDKHNNFE